MDSRELRIGNLFYPIDRSQKVHIPFERPFKVLTIGFDVESIPYDKVPAQIEKWNKFKLSELSPIPLTEEWLIRMGFEKYSDNGDFTGNDCYYCKRNLIGAISLPDFRYRDYIKIKYVHQLQNLYFALTGEELTIKSN